MFSMIKLSLFNLLFSMIQAAFCFRLYDGNDGAPAGSGGDSSASTGIDTATQKMLDGLPKDDEGNVMLDANALSSIVKHAVENSTKEEVEALRKDIRDLEKKNLFPSGYMDGDSQGMQGSVIDTKFFNRGYNRDFSGTKEDGALMGSQLVTIGGPFKHLSPEMETFAKMIKCQGSITKFMDRGVDWRKQNEKLLQDYVKLGIPVDSMKQAGMSEGVLADGGALVPTEFAATVIEFATKQSEILNKVWRMPMTSNVLKIPRLVQAAGSYFGGMNLYWIDEGDKKTGTKPQLERLTFEAKKLAGLIYLTDELIADSLINVVNYVTGLYVRAFQYEMERVILNGSGVGQPLGIIQDPNINMVARTTAGAISYQDVLNLDKAIDENFNDLSWMTRKTTQIDLMGLRDNQNRPIFMSGYDVFTKQPLGAPQMVSYPVYKTRNVPNTGSQGDLTLGDLSFYMLCMRQDMTIDTSEHVRFEWDEQTMRFVMRMDGRPAVSIAFAVLNDATS